MKRYDMPQGVGGAEHPDGEWVRYSDHIDAMKRIAGAPVAQGEAQPIGWYETEPSCRGISLQILLSGIGQMTHSARWHWQAERPETSNPVWPIYGAPAPNHADADNATLRWMLCAAYAGSKFYGDDGELQDNREFPFIDFKRDSVAEINRKMSERGNRALKAALEKNPDLLAAPPEQSQMVASGENGAGDSNEWFNSKGVLAPGVRVLAAEPVAWLTRRHKGPDEGRMEIAEPHEKASNPEYWADAFPVFAAPARGGPVEDAVRKAAQDWIDLQDRIKRAGIPPHTDYWHQSIHEAEQAIRAALLAASPADQVEDASDEALFNLLGDDA